VSLARFGARRYQCGMRTLAPLALILSLTACGSAPDVAISDAALAGQGEGDALTPVAMRPVWVGRNENRRADACTRRMQPRGESADVRWSPAADSPVKAEVSDTVLACDSEGEWTGVVFGGPGQSVDYCNLARQIRAPTEYQGPCRQGWVLTSELVSH
jgi:hypothetical protein